MLGLHPYITFVGFLGAVTPPLPPLSPDKNGTSFKQRRCDRHWPQRSVNTDQSQCSTSRHDAGAPSSCSISRRYSPGYALSNLLANEDGGAYGTTVGLTTAHGKPIASATCQPSRANKLITTKPLSCSPSPHPLLCKAPPEAILTSLVLEETTEQPNALSNARTHSCAYVVEEGSVWVDGVGVSKGWAPPNFHHGAEGGLLLVRG